MAGCSEDDDPDSMLRKRHATLPTPRFEADISLRFQASEGSCVLVNGTNHGSSICTKPMIFLPAKTFS
ncbi:hypothetical protein K443DRAFT_673725 [Laccaria amethystina LaAM-08-1]|uniref:Unplaced genomic scaffold K443scaffold_14, whole genome shotgun sequence n=1 Tax=Laccaria amethystina LaAM-08-1 TaxID=1095629 RepID=A0A0C9YGK5_9AGAR|nr:hypothetical protein K443DRAFT_673725 [Laccaria amethystina LaAM-08-1]